jgi:cobalt-precorrin-5B (C1)-methyltransferase
MLDMGDFVGGMVKYLARHPVPKLTVGGGIGKITKLAQGAVDLHSGRSQVDFDALADLADGQGEAVRSANTALEAAGLAPDLPPRIAAMAKGRVEAMLPQTEIDVVVIDRAGAILGHAT